MKAVAGFAGGIVLGIGLGWMLFRPAASAPAPVKTPAVVSPEVTPSPTVATPPTPEATKTAIERAPRKKTPGAPAEAATPVPPVIDPNPRLEAALAEARMRVAELEAKIESQAAEQAKLAAVESDLRGQVTRVTAEVEQLRRDLQQRTQRISELETARTRSAQESAAGQKNLARLRELAGEMDELNRRREAYLTNVLTRYREATELLRTMSLRLDNPRDAGTPLNNDLSRIQQAVQHADEDLRQLRSLNARAAQMQKELAQASR